jgi:hypothetical protein
MSLLFLDITSASRRLQGLVALAMVLSTALMLEGQTLIDLKSQGRNVDFSGAIATKPARVGVVLPATCSIGELFFKSDAQPGANLYACTATNVWTVQSVASAPSLPETTNLLKGDGSGNGAPANPGVDYYAPGTVISSTDLPPDIALTDAQNTFSDAGNQFLGNYDVACDASAVASSNVLVKIDTATGKCAALDAADTAAPAWGLLVSGHGTANGRVRYRGIGSCIADAGGITQYHYVINGTGTGGTCKDGGTTRPAPGVAIVGIATTSAVAGATASVRMNIDANPATSATLPSNVVLSDAPNTFSSTGNQFLGNYDVACDASAVASSNVLVKIDTATGKCAALDATDTAAPAWGLLVSGHGTANGRVRYRGIGSCIADGGGITQYHYVINGTGTGGTCKDGGTTRPAPGVAIVGIATTSAAAGATASVRMNIDANPATSATLSSNVVLNDAPNTFSNAGNQFLGRYDIPCDATSVVADGLLVKIDATTGKCTTLATADTAVPAWGLLISGSTTANGRVRFRGVGSCKADTAITAGHWIVNGTTTAGACKDGGASRPAFGTAIVGIATASAAAGDSASVDLNIQQNAAGGGGASMPRVSVYTTGGTSTACTAPTCFDMPGDNAYHAITWNAERYDTADMHDTAVNPTRLVARSDGLYIANCGVFWYSSWSAITAVRITKNGVAGFGQAFHNGGIAYDQFNAIGQIPMVAGDYVECEARQNSGVNRPIADGDGGTMFQLVKVSN